MPRICKSAICLDSRASSKNYADHRSAVFRDRSSLLWFLWFQVPGCKLQVSGFRFQVAGSKLQVHPFGKFQHSISCQRHPFGKIPNKSQFPILNIQILNDQFILSSLPLSPAPTVSPFAVLRSSIIVLFLPVAGCRFQVPGSRFQVPGFIRCSRRWRRIPSFKLLVSSFRFVIPR